MKDIFDPGLVLYLPLHEIDGGSFISRDAIGHEATVTGAFRQFDGYFFDGIDDYITIPHHNAFNLTTQLTIVVWVRPRGAYDDWDVNPTILVKEDAYKVKYEETDGTFVFEFISEGAPKWQGTATDQWDNRNYTCWVITYDSCMVRIYRNGEEAMSPRPRTEAINVNSNPVHLGGVGLGFNIGMHLGEVAVYNRPFAPPEVQRYYLATKWRYR